MKIKEYLYRYESAGQLGDSPTLYKHEIINTTPKGAWVSLYGGVWASSTCHHHAKKWVSSSSKKRFAYPTKKEAMESYVIRKMRYVENCRNNLERAERQYAALRKHDEFEAVGDVISHCDELLDRNIVYSDDSGDYDKVGVIVTKAWSGS